MTHARVDFGPTLHLRPAGDASAQYSLVRARLAAHGLVVPPGRLERFKALTAKFAAGELSPARPGDQREMSELFEGSRDFAELATIVEHLLPPSPPADSVLIAKLRHVLGGAALPSEDRNPMPRSTQFELYMTALIAKGGLVPRFREPDCVITLKGVELGLAAKRARQAAHVPRLVRDGARQLRRAGLVGIVALSLDQIFAPHDERVFGNSVEELTGLPPHLMDATLNPHWREVTRALGTESPVLAVLASLVVVSAVPRENRIGRLNGLLLKQVRPQRSRSEYDALVLHERISQRPPAI